jgi:hypothetical protein
MTKMKNLIFCAAIAVLASCTKEKPVSPAATPYYVRMTDAPGPYTAVNVDIQGVEITGNGNAVMLNINPGIYNLLNFSNGADTLIATGSLNVDKVQQIRLILGNNNSVVTGGTSYPLVIPSGSESGLKLQVHQDLQPGVAYEVLLDFDANQSVVQEGNGAYKLKPVIRTIENAISGSISGQLSVPGVSAVVTASANGATFSVPVDANGNFIIKGLPAGTYTVTVAPASPYTPATVNSVQVTVGSSTNIGVINI